MSVPRSSFVSAAALALFVSGGSAPARADVSLGLSVGAVSGVHVESGSSQNLSAPVLPFIRFYAGSKVDGFVEAIPPFGPQGFAADLDTQIQLTNAVVRYHLLPRLTIATGVSVLNQRTLYPQDAYAQSSRLTASRYEILAQPYRTARAEVEIRLAADPVLHGILLTQTASGSPVGPATEQGSEVDVGAAYRHVIGTSHAEAGLRYFNYQARYVATGGLADRNRIVYPYLAYDFTLVR